jgi:hypothetical protein
MPAVDFSAAGLRRAQKRTRKRRRGPSAVVVNARVYGGRPAAPPKRKIKSAAAVNALVYGGRPASPPPARKRRQTTVSRGPLARGPLSVLKRPIPQSGSFEAQHMRALVNSYTKDLQRQVQAAGRASEARGGFGAPKPLKKGQVSSLQTVGQTEIPTELWKTLQTLKRTPEEQGKIVSRGLHPKKAEHTAQALKVLDVLQRVNYAQAGAASEIFKGHNVKDAIKAAERGLKGKERKTFGTVLREHGVSGPVASIAGFGLDVLLDPTTYVSGGMTSIAAKEAARVGARAAETAERAGIKAELKPAQIAARKRTAAAAAVRQSLRKAERQSPWSTTRGIELRFAGKRIPGVTRGTAGARNVAKRAAEPLSESEGGRTIRKAIRGVGSEANANIRPHGQTLEEKYGIKGLTREARSESEKTVRHVTARSNALLGRLSDAERRQVIDAIEAGTVGSLRGSATKIRTRPTINPKELGARMIDVRDPDRLYTVARRVEDDLKYLHRIGQRSGLLSTGVGPKVAQRIRSVGGGRLSQAQDVGVRSQAKVRQALTVARREQADARIALRGAKPGSERITAKRRLRHAEERVENLRQRYNALGHQRTSVYARQQGAKQAIEPLKGEAKGYFPRVRQTEVKAGGVLSRLAEGGRSTVARVTGDTSNRPVAGAAMRRENRASRAAQEQTRAGQIRMGTLSEDVRKTLAQYGASVGRASAGRNLNTKLVQQLGAQVPRNMSKADVAEMEAAGHSIYRVRRGVLERVDPQSHGLITNVSRGGPKMAHPGGRAPVPAPRAKVDPKTGKVAKRGATEAGGQYAVLRDDVVDWVRNRQPDIGSQSKPIHVWDALQSKFKGLALSTPAYLMRNLTGDLWNAWGDEKWWRLARNWAKGQKALNDLGRWEKGLRDFERKLPEGKRTIKLTEKQAQQIAHATGAPVSREVPAMVVALLAEKMGVIRQGRFLELMEEGRSLGRPRGTHAWQDTVKRVEDSTRIATFLGGLQRGLDPREAAQRTAKLHFDYGDLTSFEKGYLRRNLPFYTFTARNVPLQGQLLLQHPGKFAALAHAREEGRQEAGLPFGYEEGLNPFEKRQLGIPIKWGGKTYTVSMGSPFVDLNDLTAVAHGVAGGITSLPDVAGLPHTDLGSDGLIGASDATIGRVGEMISPLLKTGPELKYNISAFYRDQIQPDTEPYTRTPRWAVELGKQVPWFRRATGMVPNYAPAEGEPGWGWTRKADYLTRALTPGAIGAILGAPGLGPEGPNARKMTTQQRLLAALGLRSQEYESNKAKLERTYDTLDKVNARVELLRRQTAPGTDERISVAHPTREFKLLYAQQKALEKELDALQKLTRVGGIVKGRRQRTGVRGALNVLGAGGGLSSGSGGLSAGGGGLSAGSSLSSR